MSTTRGVRLGGPTIETEQLAPQTNSPSDEIRLCSWATHSYWNHPYAIFASECVGTGAYHDGEGRRLTHSPCVDSVSELEEVGSRFFDSGLAALNHLSIVFEGRIPV